MNKIIKKMALASAALVLVVTVLGLLPRISSAVYNQYQATKYNDVTVLNLLLRDSGIYDSGGTLRIGVGSTITLTGNLVTTGGQQSMGSVGVALSTNNTSGLSAGDLYYAYLGGTTAAVEGSVLIATTSVTGASVSVLVAPATVGLTNVAGFASAVAATGTVVGVYSGSAWAQALTTGTVVAGDQLATSSLAAGYLYAPTTGTNSLLSSTATCAVALTAGNANGGRIRVRFKG